MTKHQLKEYCDAEFENIDTILFELFNVISAEKSRYTIIELAAIATFIHNCYNGIENIFKRILAYEQAETKDTPTWHKDLLKACLDKKLISRKLYNTLSNYLSFRHFFVHSYSLTLKW
jgi:uncharacterized protein YutE (UPF0331/DUF86 family)